MRLTAGSGFRYENFVAARFLLDMLAGSNALGADFGRVMRLDWQARDDGWLADDLALSCETSAGEKRSAGISIKSYEQVTTAGFPADFVDIAWSQWLGQGTKRVFCRGVDAIVLITADLRGDVKAAWSALQREALETTPERILARLTPGPGNGSQSSQLQRALVESFKCSEKHAGDGTAHPNDTVRVLHDVYLVDLDYKNKTSQDRIAALLACQNLLTSGDAADAQRLWDRLVGIADDKRPAGGSLDLPGLLSELRAEFSFRDHPDYRQDWDALRRRSSEAIDDIRTNIAETAHLPRDDDRWKIQANLNSDGACLLIGESGSGKSALSKELATTHYPRVVWLAESTLSHDSVVEFEGALRLHHPLEEVLRCSPERCLVVFDAIEGYPDRALRLASRLIKDLYAHGATHVHFLLSVQFESADRKIRQLVGLGVPSAALQPIPVGRPSDDDVQHLLANIPQLRWVALRPELRPLLSNLKIFDWFARTLAATPSVTTSTYLGLTSLIDILWEHWTEGADDSFARSRLLMNLGTLEAETLSRGVPRLQLDHSEQAALPALIRSDLLRVHDERVFFTHDLLGDWARTRVLVGDDPTSSPSSRNRAASPRWQQAIRFFGQRLLERSDNGHERWRRSVEEVNEGSVPNELLRDLFLDAVILASNAAELLNRTWTTLTANRGQLLNRLLDRFLFVATLPDPRLGAFSAEEDDATSLEHLFRVPFWPYWGPLFEVLYARRLEVVSLAPYLAGKACALWLRSMPVELAPGRPMPWRQEAAELAIEIAREIQARNAEGYYYAREHDRIIYEAALLAAAELPQDSAALCLELAARRPLASSIAARVDAARRKRAEERKERPTPRTEMLPAFPLGRRRAPWPDGPHGDVQRAFQEACLDTGAFATLVRAAPKIALEVLLAVCIEGPQHEHVLGPSSLPETGLSYWSEGEPSAYFRGPFLQFFRLAPQEALSFIIKLANFGTRRYTQDRIWLDVELDGRKKRWFGDANAFRWHHDWPLSHGHQIQSGLMALEQWLYEQIDQGTNIEPWITRILNESESLVFAGLLLDVGKRLPDLFRSVLAPLFFTWELWDWDFQLAILRHSGQGMIGYWDRQAPQLFALAQKWHRLSHRAQALLAFDGPIPRTMLGHDEFQTFFSDVRTAWAGRLVEREPVPNHLRLLIERINPDNYAFQKNGNEILPIDFRWPEAIARENEESLRKLAERQTLTALPRQCRKLLDDGSPLSLEQREAFWTFLHTIDVTPPDIPLDSGEPLLRIEDVFCGVVAVLLDSSREWLSKAPSRIAWCRQKLQATLDTPPPPRRFDSELSIGDWRWDSFAAECGVRLLVEDQEDTLARKLVAAGVTAFNYNTTALTMALAAHRRQHLSKTFGQIVALAINWAALRPQHPRPTPQSTESEQIDWVKRKTDLIDAFVNGTLSPQRPNLPNTNADTRRALDALHERQFPGAGVRRRYSARAVGRSRSPEKLYPERLGLDSYAIKATFGWLNVDAAETPEERRDWIDLIREFLSVLLQSVPVVKDITKQKIDGLPSDFDDWVLKLIAGTIPRLNSSEHPNELWRSLFDRGAAAHEWIERFFWQWFTDGVRAAKSPAEFVRLWRTMILYTLEHPAWDPLKSIRYELENMVFELLGFDPRWSAMAMSENFARAVGTLEDVFARTAQKWFVMPKVVNGFAMFAVQPAAMKLMLPGVHWVASAAKDFDTYDWKYGLEDNVIEFLHTCWQRESETISNDPTLREPFIALLAILVSRGGHAAIALRDRVVGSISA